MHVFNVPLILIIKGDIHAFHILIAYFTYWIILLRVNFLICPAEANLDLDLESLYNTNCAFATYVKYIRNRKIPSHAKCSSN